MLLGVRDKQHRNKSSGPPSTLIPLDSPTLYSTPARFYHSTTHLRQFSGQLTCQQVHEIQLKNGAPGGNPHVGSCACAKPTEEALDIRIEPRSLELWGNCAPVQPPNLHINILDSDPSCRTNTYFQRHHSQAKEQMYEKLHLVFNSVTSSTLEKAEADTQSTGPTPSFQLYASISSPAPILTHLSVASSLSLQGPVQLEQQLSFCLSILKTHEIKNFR